MRLGVFSVSMPEYDPAQTVRLLAQAGFDAVEWRMTAPTPEERGPGYSHDRRYWSNNRSTLDWDRPAEALAEAKALCDEAGIAISAIGGYRQAEDYNGVVRCIAAAGAVGCKKLRVAMPKYGGEPGYTALFEKTRAQLQRLAQPAAEHGVKLLLENHMDTIIPSVSAAQRLVDGFSPEVVGVIVDPGNMVYEGYERYRMGFELLGPHLAHVHVKNARWVRDDAGKWRAEFCPMDAGIADIPDFLAQLRAFGYDGDVSVEDFSNEDETAAKLQKLHAMLRPLVAG